MSADLQPNAKQALEVLPQRYSCGINGIPQTHDLEETAQPVRAALAKSTAPDLQMRRVFGTLEALAGLFYKGFEVSIKTYD
jgi:hypothetical protein